MGPAIVWPISRIVSTTVSDGLEVSQEIRLIAIRVRRRKAQRTVNRPKGSEVAAQLATRNEIQRGYEQRRCGQKLPSAFVRALTRGETMALRSKLLSSYVVPETI